MSFISNTDIVKYNPVARGDPTRNTATFPSC